MKRIPLKNYFILGIILVSSIFIVLYINKLYLSTKNNDNKSFEKKFKKLVTKYDLQKDIVFIDISQFNDETFNNFCKKYADKLLKKDSSLIIVDNQKVIDALDITKGNNDIELVKMFFKKNGVY